ncbi:hypothetical protein [Burkholderia thailandensis]|uniref:hypothetical protein n=1 Tax=Burkholderia thailandensis TaxID=57975 RepID=UPI003F8FBD47
MDKQRGDLTPDETLHVAAATLLPLAGKTVCASDTPPWGRKCALELLDALLELATLHRFAQAEVMRTKLITGSRTKHTQLLAEVAFDAVPASAPLDVIRQSGFYIGEWL